jgi:transcriptional regulator with XRE-family HTH domain
MSVLRNNKNVSVEGFAGRLRFLMKERGMTFEDLKKAIQAKTGLNTLYTSAPYLQKYCSKDKSPTLRIAKNIAKALDIDVCYLTYGDDSKYKLNEIKELINGNDQVKMDYALLIKSILDK